MSWGPTERRRRRGWSLGLLTVWGLAGLLCLNGCLTTPAWRESFSERASQPGEVWTPPPATGQPSGPGVEKPFLMVPPPDQELSLARLVDLALHNNPTTRQAWEEARISAAEMGVARAVWYPSLSLTYDVNYQAKGKQLGAEEYEETNWGPSLQLTYLLWEMGGREAAVEEARQTLIAANYSYNQAIQDLILAVEEDYYLYLAARGQTTTVQDQLEATRVALKVAEEKHTLGLVAKTDVLQAKASEAQAVYDLEQAQGNQRLAAVSLAVTVGLSADHELKVAAPVKLPPRELDEQADKMVTKAFEARPDLLALRASISGSRAAVKSAEAALWPTLGTKAQIDRNDFNDKSGSWDLGAFVILNFDIFEGFSQLYQKRVAEATLRSAEAELAAAEFDAQTEIWSYYIAYKTAWRQIESAQALTTAASESYEAQLASYKLGLADLLDALNAQNQLTEAKAKLISAKTSLFLALTRLTHACGSLVRPSLGE